MTKYVIVVSTPLAECDVWGPYKSEEKALDKVRDWYRASVVPEACTYPVANWETATLDQINYWWCRTYYGEKYEDADHWYVEIRPLRKLGKDGY